MPRDRGTGFDIQRARKILGQVARIAAYGVTFFLLPIFLAGFLALALIASYTGWGYGLLDWIAGRR